MAAALWKVKPPIDAANQGIWVGPKSKSTKDGLWLGSLGELGAGKIPQVWLAMAKEQVIAIVGKRGSGKSFTLGVIVEGLAVSSDSPTIATQASQRATLLFDPLDVYWTSHFAVAPSQNAEANRHYELAKAAKVTGATFAVDAWVPGTVNRRATDPPWFQSLQIGVPLLGLDEWGLLLDVSILTEPIGHALTDAINLAARAGYNAQGKFNPPASSYSLGNLRAAAASDEMSASYHPETIRALRQRLASLENTGLFSATGTPVPQLLARGKVSVILLGRLGLEYRGAVVAVLTRLLLEERSKIAFAEKRLALDPSLSDQEKLQLAAEVNSGVPRTVVCLDEAQTFLAPGQTGVAREVFVRLVKEGRNMGLSAVLATQQPSAMDSRILSQVETFITHQLVTEPDIQAVRGNLKAALPDVAEFGKMDVRPADMLRMLEPGQCLVSASDMNTAVRRSIIVNIRPRATVHGGIEL